MADTNKGVAAILQLSGLSSTNQKGYLPAGNSRLGQDVYTSNVLANSTDITSGTKLLHILAAYLNPFHVLDKKEVASLEALAKNSSNQKTLTELDSAFDKSNGKLFARLILTAAENGRTTNKIGLAGSYMIYQHWGLMSPAQKSISIAALGIQTHQTAQGGYICDLPIVRGPKGELFTVKDALDMKNAGKNPYQLVRFWEQIERLHRVFNGPPTAKSMIDFADSHHLLGAGLKGQAVQGVTTKVIHEAGAKPAPQYGVGTLAAPPGKGKLPKGYTHVAASKQANLITPTANVPTAAGALQGSLFGTQGGVGGIPQDSAVVHSKWAKAGKVADDKGSEGGSSFIAALHALKTTNSYLYGALVTFIMHNAHENVDTNNPLKWFVALAGIAFARIVRGSDIKEVDMAGVQIANSLMNDDVMDWAKAQVAMKKLAATHGISSRAVAFQLSNQAYSEGRISESDLVAMQELFTIVYNKDGLAMAQKLFHGAKVGAQIARQDYPIKNTMTDYDMKQSKAAVETNAKDEARRRNAMKYRQQKAAQDHAIQTAPDPTEGNEQQPGEPPEGSDTIPDDTQSPDSGPITPNQEAGETAAINGAA